VTTARALSSEKSRPSLTLPRQTAKNSAPVTVLVSDSSMSNKHRQTKSEKLLKKQTYKKTETYKLYSTVFWTFLPNVIQIDRYNFELHHFKVGAFFETRCS